MARFVAIFLIFFITSAYAKESGPDRPACLKLSSLSVDNSAGVSRLSFGVEGGFLPIGTAGGNLKKWDSSPRRIVGVQNDEWSADIRKAAEKSLEYFFIGLVLPDDKFWVNLNPKEPQRIIDSILADTDLGRIMLYADLRLKKDTCELMDPNESQTGVEYWNRLYKKARSLGAGGKIPLINRVWIVPDEVMAYETENQIFIIESRLKVCIEEESGSADDELQAYALSLLKELILPQLSKKVNESELYAELREVYQALILSRWFRQKFLGERNFSLQTVSYNVIKDTQIDFLFRPDQMYRDFINSFKKGQYTINEGFDSFYSAMSIVQYFIGGVNFKAMPKMIQAVNKDKQNKSANFVINFEVPKEWFDLEQPLQFVKNTIQLIPEETSYGGVAVVMDKNHANLVLEGLPLADEVIVEKIESTARQRIGYIMALNNKL